MVEVVIPWRGDDCPHRLAALRFVLPHYGALGYPVTIAPGPTPWIKADAVMPAVESSRADVVIVADADVFLGNPHGLSQAVEEVRRGAPWAIPHRWLLRLNEAATQRVYAGEGYDANAASLVERPRVGWQGGGYVVARRETLLDVPMDRRFVGWGGEDESWATALRLLVGKPTRGRARLVHLWHPPQEREERRIGSRASMRLVRRYAAARDNPAAMRRLIEEGRWTSPRS